MALRAKAWIDAVLDFEGTVLGLVLQTPPSQGGFEIVVSPWSSDAERWLAAVCAAELADNPAMGLVARFFIRGGAL